MAKLIFKYGVMNSGKTTTLLMIANDYERRGKKVLITKSKIDSKGDNYLVSRLNNNTFKRKIDFYIEDLDKYIDTLNCDVILVDEAHFLKKNYIMKLVDVVTKLNIPVVCFGLKVDFKGNPFEGSSYLFALANRVEEIGVKAICSCGSIANMNLLLVDKQPVFSGDQIKIDDGLCEFIPLCLKCYMKKYDNDY